MADADAEKKAEQDKSDAVELTESGAVEESAAAEPVESAAEEAKDDKSDDAKADDATDSSDEDEDISLEEPEEEKQRRAWVRPALLGAAAVLALALVIGTVVLGYFWKKERDTETASKEALVAAQQYAKVLTDIDSGKIDDNFSKVLDGSTGEFKDMYSKSSAQLRQVLVDNKAKANGMVVDAAVKSATKNEVEVLLFVDQSVSNVSVPEPRLDRSRVLMTMQKVDGRWLASKVQLP